MNLHGSRGTPDSLKLRFKGFERKLPLGAPDINAYSTFEVMRIEDTMTQDEFSWYTVSQS